MLFDDESDEMNKIFGCHFSQHTVPTLVDDGFVLIESRAIAIYLIEKHFPSGHSLYPKDATERASINQKLQFDCGTLYPRIRAVAVNVFISIFVCNERISIVM